MDLGTASTFLFDFDGTLWCGDGPATGAHELLARLRVRGKRVVVLSNNSQLTGVEIANLIECAIGISVDAITVVDIVPGYLERMGLAGVTRVVGAPALIRACENAGTIPGDGVRSTCKAILLGCSPAFDYNDIREIVNAADRGVRLLATNPDAFRPGPNATRVPETGALVAAIQAISDAPWEIIGKPQAALYNEALRRSDSMPDQAVLIGDGLETDIRGSARLGIRSIWISAERAPAGSPTPTHQTSSLDGVGECLS